MPTVIHNAEVMAGANRFSRMLDRVGVARRGVVAALLDNTPEYLQAYRGATWSGRYFTPMSWRWTPEDVDYVVGNCEAAALVVDARFAAAAAAAARRVPEARRFAVGGAIEGFRSFRDIEVEASGAYPDALAGETLLYTSGTTGRPKGVVRTAVADGPPPTVTGAAGMAMMSAFLPEGDRGGPHLVAAPLYHAGPNTYCDGALLLGSDVVLLERFDPEELLRAIEHYRIHSTFLVPTHFVRLLRLPEEVRARYDVSSLRLVCHGAAPVAIDVKRKMIEWWGPVLFEFYGGTEGGGCMIGAQEWLEKPGSVGRPRPGVSLAILDDAGDPLPAGREGRVCFDVAATPFEYKGDPDKTAEGRVGAEWFTLGDIGYADEDGYLFLCDRRADVIVSGGVNIYPAQIESVLLELPFVADCCVVGAPNEEWGEEVRAVVQLVSGPGPGGLEGREIEQAVIAHCRERLAGYQVPRALDIDPALPRTETGKLARHRVRSRYWQGRTRRV